MIFFHHLYHKSFISPSFNQLFLKKSSNNLLIAKQMFCICDYFHDFPRKKKILQEEMARFFPKLYLAVNLQSLLVVNAVMNHLCKSHGLLTIKQAKLCAEVSHITEHELLQLQDTNKRRKMVCELLICVFASYKLEINECISDGTDGVELLTCLCTCRGDHDSKPRNTACQMYS